MDHTLNRILWSLATSYVILRVAQLFPLPLLLVVALSVLLPLAFTLLHGSRTYGWRAMLLFCALGLLVGNGMENLSIATGFPFGHYYFTAEMGPKVFQVPIALGLAYLGIGYLSWTIGAVLVCPGRIVLIPLVATTCMVAWDAAMDPAWGTVLRLWVWRDGGPYFGVPLSNFAGWFLTVYIFFQLFALGLTLPVFHQSGPHNTPQSDRQAIIFYLSCALGNALLMAATRGVAGLANPVTRTVIDPTGKLWHVENIALVSALVSLFIMGGLAVWALICLNPRPNSA